jgi:uroporphyrin-III C-methyltransferase/precorrin-2 dehydrogenase/sirohydrochlorin ferrochelatase
MPAIVDRSPLIIAIGSGGNSPTLARRVRAQIEALLPQRLGELAALAGRWRERVQAALPDVPARRRFWDRFYDGAGALSDGGRDAAALDTALAQALAAAQHHEVRGEVWLIGAGPGDADLLTLRALQLLQQCDVVLYDRLVDESVLERVRRDAERVFVGKESGQHRTTQTRINELLLNYARRGLRVARLKGGDPLVFGRGGEELAVLAAAGIPVTVVPGVTAALGGAAAAGIPLTHRGVSQSVSFVTAMGEATDSLDWRSLAAPLQTAVFYMGVAQLPRIVQHLHTHGAPMERGAAIVERATLPGQRVVAGTLMDIVARAEAALVKAPALLIVGDVVRHAFKNQD